MIDFKSLGVAFGGMAMVAGLSYLSKRSSGAKAEVSRKYVTDEGRGESSAEYKEIMAVRGNDDRVLETIQKQWSKVRSDRFPAVSDSRVHRALTAIALVGAGDSCVITGEDLSELSDRLGVDSKRSDLFWPTVAAVRKELCKNLSRPTEDALNDEEIDLALDVASKFARRTMSNGVRSGFDIARKKKLNREGNRPEYAYLDDKEALDALIELENTLEGTNADIHAPERTLKGEAFCEDPGVDPKECAMVAQKLREALEAIPDWPASAGVSRDYLVRVARRGSNDEEERFKAKLRMQARQAFRPDVIRPWITRSKWSNLVAAFNAIDNRRPILEFDLDKIDAASKLPEEKGRRITAAILEDPIEGNPRLSSAFWPDHLPLAPSYPDLYRQDAGRVAKGERIQEVFDPVPLEWARNFWKGPMNRSGSSDNVRREYFLQTCPDFQDDDYRDLLIERTHREKNTRKWLSSMCLDKNKSRFDAFVSKREFPLALGAGETRESTYLQEIVSLLNNVEPPPNTPSPGDSPESFERALRAVKAMNDLRYYEQISGQHEAPIPRWWPEDTVAELDANGEHLRLLRTCRDIVREGIELDHCTKEPDNYCPKVESGRSAIVSMKLDPQVDEKGAVRTRGHRSTMEFMQGPLYGPLPELNQHYGYRNMKVENPRAIATRDKLLAGIRKFVERKG